MDRSSYKSNSQAAGLYTPTRSVILSLARLWWPPPVELVTAATPWLPEGLRNSEPLARASPRPADSFHRLHHALHFLGRDRPVIGMYDPVSRLPDELEFCYQGQVDDSTGGQIREQLSSGALFPTQRSRIHPARRDVQQALVFLRSDLAGNGRILLDQDVRQLQAAKTPQERSNHLRCTPP